MTGYCRNERPDVPECARYCAGGKKPSLSTLIGWFDGGIGRIHIKWLSFAETEKEREAMGDAAFMLCC
jgi:hypothetical protein